MCQFHRYLDTLDTIKQLEDWSAGIWCQGRHDNTAHDNDKDDDKDEDEDG